MGNFNRDNRRPGGDRGNRGDKRSFGGDRSRDRGFGGGHRNRDSRIMHQVVCDGCGNDCEVPFRPTSGKPIYCSDCFKKGNSRPQHDNRPSGRGQDNEQFTAVLNGLNKKLDQILNILQAPVIEKSQDKPKASKQKAEAKIPKIKAKPKAKKVAKKKK